MERFFYPKMDMVGPKQKERIKRHLQEDSEHNLAKVMRDPEDLPNCPTCKSNADTVLTSPVILEGTFYCLKCELGWCQPW